MSLLDLWEKSPDELLTKRLWQVIAIAGDGKLIDKADASVHFREFLSRVPLEPFARWAKQAVEGKFDDSGLALQDIVNEIGRRLGFEVRSGRYRGGGRESYDGLWVCRTGHSIVVETKTSDTYMDPKKLAEYRQQLIHSKQVTEQASSMLLVVGREDSGDAEERIKGSRYAFDMRVITVDGLLRLLSLKQAATDQCSSANLSGKIFELFASPKFISLDPIADLLAALPRLPAPGQSFEREALKELHDEHPPDGKVAQAIVDMVRAGAARGVSRRNLQRRFHRVGANQFGELLHLLTNSLRLRIEKRGRRIIVMLGEGALKDEVLLALARFYEVGNPRVGLPVRDFAIEKGFAPDLVDRLVAELRAEGAVELVMGVPGVFRFTDSGYQRYLPRIQALRAIVGGA